MAINKIVVLHGLYMSGFVMQPLCNKLKKHQFEILNLTYNTLSPDKSEIFSQIDDFIAHDQAALVCHSMGGLIARAYLDNHSQISEQVEKVITLGTPHKGSMFAKQMYEKGLDVFLKNSVEFLVSDNQDWPYRARLYSIAGDLPLGLMPILQKGSKSDGTVLLEETKLQGMAEHKVFHVSHASMIYSRKVTDYVLSLLTDSK